MIKGKVFISGGPMGEGKAQQSMNYGTVEKKVMDLEHEHVCVLNILPLDKKDLKDTLAVTLHEMLQCDTLLLMPDWSASPRAVTERLVATQVNMNIHYITTIEEFKKYGK